MESKYVTYNEMCNRMKNIIFGYQNVDERVKNNIYEQIVAESTYAHNEAMKILKDVMNVNDETIKKIDEFRENNPMNDEVQEMVNELVSKTIMQHIKDKTIKKDGYCPKITLLHKAVQMRHDYTMLGVITDFDDDNTRFVFVDFGEEEGAVKLDIDELIIAQ